MNKIIFLNKTCEKIFETSFEYTTTRSIEPGLGWNLYDILDFRHGIYLKTNNDNFTEYKNFKDDIFGLVIIEKSNLTVIWNISKIHTENHLFVDNDTNKQYNLLLKTDGRYLIDNISVETIKNLIHLL